MFWSVAGAIEIDLGGCRIIPGFIDGHAHVTGGGGEAGFSTRVPPVPLGSFTTAGVTSVVGVLGTDDTTRDTRALLAQTICSAKDIPITLEAAAEHNIANALGAAALSEQLGLSLTSIANGLKTMTQASNPGRSNVFEIDGFKVLLDFAHNPEAMQALFNMAKALPAKRRVLCFGQAGDRTDQQIRELARSAWSIGLEMVIISELSSYARGRDPGEVVGIIRDELLAAGAREDQIQHHQEEHESFAAALDWADSGDLVVILDLGRVSDIQETLTSRTQ